MITKTALKSPAFLARVKAASVCAVKVAHGPAPIPGVGWAHVLNGKGRYSLRVVWHSRSGSLEFFDRADRDVTAVVLAALREWHAEQRAARPPVMQVRQASAAEWSHAVMVQAIRRKHWRADRLANLQRIGEA